MREEEGETLGEVGRKLNIVEGRMKERMERRKRKGDRRIAERKNGCGMEKRGTENGEKREGKTLEDRHHTQMNIYTVNLLARCWSKDGTGVRGQQER